MDESFCKTFCSNLTRNFDYNVNNIQDELNLREFNVLKGLRNNLLTKLIENDNFATYSGKSAINRIKANKVCQDIIILGVSLAKNKPDDNLNSVFKGKSELDQQPDLTDPDNLIAKVVQLQYNYDALKEDFDALILDKDEKDEKIKSLETRMAILEAKSENHNEQTSQNEEAIVPDITINDIQSDQPTPSSDPDSDIDDNQPLITKKRKRVFKYTRGQLKPVEAAPKTAYAYIGNVKPENTWADILFNIYTYTGMEIKSSDIQELNTRGPNKSFKIAVPQDKLEAITSNLIWVENIKAGPFGQPRSKGHSSNQTRRSHNNHSSRSHERSQTFPGPTQTTQNPQRYQPNRQWNKPTKPVEAGSQTRQYPPNGYYQPPYRH